MNKKSAKVLQKAGMLLATMMMFTMLTVPGWAQESTPASSAASSEANPGAQEQAPVPQPLTVQSFISDGDISITGYTVVDAAGGELQHVAVGQKCRIMISLIDSRIKTPAGYSDGNPEVEAKKAELLTPQGESAFAANIKISSTENYDSPTLGDIGTTTLFPGNITSNGLGYTIILNDITYRGGKNELPLDISYNKYGLGMKSITQNISQCYEEKAPEGKATTLVIPSVSFGTNSVMAGSDFTLTVDVLASKGTVGTDNVSVDLTLSPEFTSTSGSTGVFIGSMAPGAKQQVSFQLTASAVANSGSYSITVNVSGMAASDGTAQTVTKAISIPITQPERFEISRTELPDYLSEGEEGFAYASLVNKGKGTIYNVSAEILGEGIAADGSQFIGNVAPGTETTADMTIHTTQTGSIPAQLVITYEDEKGNEKKMTKEFTITVESMPAMSDDPMGGMDMPMPEEPEQSGVSVWVWAVIGAGVIIAVVVVIVVLKKKKAKRRAAELLEDEDEDI